jgi:hypothetical protein
MMGAPSSPYAQRFRVRARLKPDERDIASAFLGRGTRRPNVALEGCHAGPCATVTEPEEQ